MFVRPAIAARAPRFGRAPARVLAEPAEHRWSISDDLKLFTATFIAGFLFVSILIG